MLGQVRNAQHPASRAWCGSGRTASPSHSAWSGDEMAQSEQLLCFCGGPAARDDVVGRRPLTSTGARGPDAGPPAPRPSSGRLDLWLPQRLSRVPHPEITPSGQVRLCPRPATDVGALLTTRDRAHTLCVERSHMGDTSRGPGCSGPPRRPANNRGVACGRRQTWEVPLLLFIIFNFSYKI